MGAGLSAMWRGTDAGPTMNGGGDRSQQCAHSSTSSACTLSGEYRSLNAYKLLDVLGDGTIGVVRLVRHKRTGLHFALKAMAKDAVTSRGARMAALVEGERDALGELERSPHARIARMFAHFQDAASLYILLEYVPGGELRSKMRKHGRFSENVTRFYVASIATALDHLHTVVGVAHRDLKPENVLLDVAGYPKLVDLGSCARLRGERKGGGERGGRRGERGEGAHDTGHPGVFGPRTRDGRRRRRTRRHSRIRREGGGLVGARGDGVRAHRGSTAVHGA
jgi:serine/threonine protein kinase